MLLYPLFLHSLVHSKCSLVYYSIVQYKCADTFLSQKQFDLSENMEKCALNFGFTSRFIVRKQSQNALPNSAAGNYVVLL